MFHFGGDSSRVARRQSTGDIQRLERRAHDEPEERQVTHSRNHTDKRQFIVTKTRILTMCAAAAAVVVAGFAIASQPAAAIGPSDLSCFNPFGDTTPAFCSDGGGGLDTGGVVGTPDPIPFNDLPFRKPLPKGRKGGNG